MKITLMERAVDDLRALELEQRTRTPEVVLALPDALGQPQLHSGLGIRRIHRSGVWEARVGLGLRVLFLLSANELVLVTIGDHDAVRRFLRTL